MEKRLNEMLNTKQPNAHEHGHGHEGEQQEVHSGLIAIPSNRSARTDRTIMS